MEGFRYFPPLVTVTQNLFLRAQMEVVTPSQIQLLLQNLKKLQPVARAVGVT